MPTTTSARPIPDALIHLTPVVPLVAAVLIAGNTDLWLVAFAPLGPLLLGPVLAGRRSIGRSHLIATVEFASTIAVAALATYACIWLGLNVSAFALFIPLGVLLTLGLAANFVFMTLAGVWRSFRGVVIEYPWVIPIRDRLPALPETGFGERR